MRSEKKFDAVKMMREIRDKWMTNANRFWKRWRNQI